MTDRRIMKISNYTAEHTSWQPCAACGELRFPTYLIDGLCCHCHNAGVERTLIIKLRTDPLARFAFIRGLQVRYSEYRRKAGTLPAREWAVAELAPDVWNELFSIGRGGSYGVSSLRGLTRQDGRRVTRGF